MKDMRNNYFGYNLKYLRERYHLTQQKMGEIVGKSYRAISRWELGEREPQNNDIQKLCDWSGLEPSDLMYRKLDEQTKSLLNAQEIELLSICKLLNKEQLSVLIDVAKNMVK